MLELLTGGAENRILFPVAILAAFFFTFAALVAGRKILPRDQGRKFAVNGALSEGKPRGAGLIFISVYILTAALTVKLNLELICYLALAFLAMLSGYLDDAAEKPWGELKKGLIDLVLSFGLSGVFYYYNSSEIRLALAGISVTLHPVLFVILGAVLVWASINVTNCTDGVDGLCGTLSVISLLTAVALIGIFGGDKRFLVLLLILVFCVIAYLWFNASPSRLLMGDAGSRALGVMLAAAALKTGAPVLFLLTSFVFIVDGGLGLVKLSAIRYLRLKNFMKNIRTPIHDHARKNKGWSDTQVVFRFAIVQALISAVLLGYLA